MNASDRRKEPPLKTMDDLERAIDAIQDRRETEYGIVKEQNHVIDLLEGNLSKAHSDGMRQKIQDDLDMARSAKWKAEKNIANQDSVLGVLGSKRDSMRRAEAEES